MKTELLKKEDTKVSFKITIENEKFEDAVKKAYNKTKSKFNIPGFRKGKAPQKIIEANYGKGVFYDDALDILFPEVYPTAVEELKLEVVDRPSVGVEEISKENGVVLTFEVEVMPEFEVKNYKGIEVKKEETLVSEDEVLVELKSKADRNARLVTVEDKAVESGDTAVIDYEGFDGEVAFAGGKGENYSLVIGSNTFIPGFEDQLIGKKAGEEVDVNVTFPEKYHAPELAGKPVVFKVKVNEVKVKETPELNDDFAKDISEFDTLDELKADIKAKLQEKADLDAKAKLENEIIEKVCENTELEVPNAMVESQIDTLIMQLNYQLQYQGMNLDALLKMTGRDISELREERREDAKKLVKAEIVLNKIASLENITATDEEVDSELEKMASMYKMEVEKLKSAMGAELNSLKEDIKLRKVVKLLVENAKIA